MVGVLCCIVKGRVTAASVTVTTLRNIRHDLNIFIICIKMNFMLNVIIGKFVTQP